MLSHDADVDARVPEKEQRGPGRLLQVPVIAEPAAGKKEYLSLFGRQTRDIQALRPLSALGFRLSHSVVFSVQTLYDRFVCIKPQPLLDQLELEFAHHL